MGGHQATSPSSSLGHQATLPTSSLGHQATSLASSSLASSSLGHQATLPTLSLGHQATFHNTKHFSQASNLEVMGKSNKPDLDEQLRYMRLMHLTGCLHSAPAALLALLDAAFFYISQDAVDLIANFQWVKDSNGGRLVLPEADNIGQWLDLALEPSAWRNLIRLTSKLSLAQTQDQRRLQLWRKKITDIYLVMKLTPPSLTSFTASMDKTMMGRLAVRLSC